MARKPSFWVPGGSGDLDRLTGGHCNMAEHRLGDPKHDPRRIELFGYVDGDKVFQAGSPPGSQSRSLMSAGLGSRFSIGGISFSAEAGVPIKFQGKNKPVRA